MRRRWYKLSKWKRGLIVLFGVISAVICGLASLFLYSQTQSNSPAYIQRWFTDQNSHKTLSTIQNEPCPNAPFLLPSQGLIGLLWNDPAGPYNIFRRHSGIDIFGDGDSGTVPVYAAYDGYLTRKPNWVSAVIIQHDDPLHQGRKIWTYYAHMASKDGKSYIVEDFPMGTQGVFVQQGTLLGYQGEYNGNSLRPIGMHLHFSIVKSEADGSFKNETIVGNTLDPSPYFGMPLNIAQKPSRPIGCRS